MLALTAVPKLVAFVLLIVITAPEAVAEKPSIALTAVARSAARGSRLLPAQRELDGPSVAGGDRSAEGDLHRMDIRRRDVYVARGRANRAGGRDLHAGREAATVALDENEERAIARRGEGGGGRVGVDLRRQRCSDLRERRGAGANGAGVRGAVERERPGLAGDRLAGKRY